MSNYDFQSLSSYDFELLARDLIQAEFRIRLESFAPGPDGGIDFRFQTKKGDLVVQCKHYKDYDVLYRVLKRDEVPKVNRLEPARYVLAVSTPLTPHRKDALLKLFSPHCLGPGDIFGREDLNNLLGRHRNVERNHVKLWLTSEAVLTRFLDRGVWGDSELTLQRIRERTRRYVANESFTRARKLLNRHHYCIIVGIPGIGKTTLAEILLIDYADRHGYQAIRIANDLSEIKAVKNPHSRQIFYFDDFLGTTALDKLQKNEDKRLMEFLEEVAANKKWRFLLTTREYILNTATIRYESLANPTVELAPCIVDLADYTRPIRARILYNHIFFSDLPDEYKRALLEGKRYSTILAHTNYNPRIVEHMTQYHKVRDIAPARYFDTFVQNLANPARIWDHAFRNHLREASQHALLALASMAGDVLLADLKVAFDSLYEHRRKKIGFSTSSRDFEHALKELDGNFIKTTLVGEDQVVGFHNPSVKDYLESYLADSPDDISDIFESATFFDQFKQLWLGQRGHRFSGVDDHSSEFAQALSRRFDAPTCRIRRRGDGHGNVIGMRRGELSFEARMLFAVDVVKGLATAAAEALLDQLTITLNERLQSGAASRDDLVDLLPALDFRKTTSKSIFDASKIFLAAGLDEFEDFSSLGRFVEKFPDAISPEELARVGAEFVKFSEDYADGSEHDPGVLRNVAEEITSVGNQLNVDVSDVAEPLLEKADQLEREGPSEDYDRSDSDGSWLDASRALQDVDVMFDGLLREITERTS
jgi:hypothetical protein